MTTRREAWPDAPPSEPLDQVRQALERAERPGPVATGRAMAGGWSPSQVSTGLRAIAGLLGIYLSLHLDLPTGATIVVTFGGVLLIMAAARPFLRGRGPDVRLKADVTERRSA